MQIWAESGKSALPICNYSQILYQFLTFTQNLKRSRNQEQVQRMILSILVYTLFSRMFDLMQPPVVKHSIAVA